MGSLFKQAAFVTNNQKTFDSSNNNGLADQIKGCIEQLRQITQQEAQVDWLFFPNKLKLLWKPNQNRNWVKWIVTFEK